MTSDADKSTEVPTFDKMLWPTLQALREIGGSGTIQEIMDKVSEIEGFTESQINALLGKGPRTKISDRLHWARTYLKMVNALENNERGVWAPTNYGRGLTEVETSEIPARVRKMRAGKVGNGNRNAKSPKSPVSKVPGIAATEPPIEQVDDTDPQAWRDSLLDLLMSMPPTKFEILCQRILRESGVMDVKVTQRSKDGGIDGTGVLRLKLLSFTVAFQCKRYQGNVSNGEVRDFRGAMAGRTDKGIFVTTDTFTPDAKKEATRTGVPVIDLIDGDELCTILKQLGLGVRIRHVEEISIDSQWFSDI